MLLNSGSDQHVVDPNLLPRVNDFMAVVIELKEPVTIKCGGYGTVYATARAVLEGIATHSSGAKYRHLFPVLLAPGMGAHLFSSTKAAYHGVSILRSAS